MRRSQLSALLTVLGLVVAACGGAETDAPPDTDGATTPTAAGPGDTSDSEEPQSEEQPEEPAPGGQDLPFESGTGYFEVDGQRHEPSYIVRCIPVSFGGDPHEDDLDLRGHLLQDGVGLEVEVSVEEVSSFTDPSVGYRANRIWLFLHTSGDEGIVQYETGFVNDPDGNWYSSEDLVPQMAVEGQEPQGPPLPASTTFTIDDDRITGAASLLQSYPEETGTVDVTFDYTIPSEEFDCDQL
jgi:hypothetical protein